MSSHRTNSDSYKDPSTLEEEADQVRARLGHNIDEIGDRLSPGDLVDQVMDFAGEHGGEFGRNLGRQVKNNPLPLLMTGIGMTWLLASSNESPRSGYRSGDIYGRESEYPRVPAGSRARVGTTDLYHDSDSDSLGDRAAQTAQSAKSKLGNAKDKLGNARDRIAGSARSAKSKIKGNAQAAGSGISHGVDATGSAITDARDSARYKGSEAYYATRSGAESLSENFTRLLDEQPLAMGALGVALGAALGGLLPRTRQEDEFMGDSRDHLVDKGKSMAADTYEDARDTVKSKAKEVESTLKKKSKDDRSSQTSANR